MRLKGKQLLIISLSLLAAGTIASVSTMAANFSKSYVVKGKRYYPMASVKKGYTETGTASWYDVPTNYGSQTASGERLNDKAMTAASPILPMNTKVRVTNLANHKSVIVRINDRGPYNSIYGPYKSKRIMDLTKAAATKLGYEDAGTAKVKITVI